MPKLPRGMFRRGKGGTYYHRVRQGGKDKWVSLGKEYDEACRRFHALRSGAMTPSGKMTVKQAAQQWLEGYVRTRRIERDVRLAARRVQVYLEPFLGAKPVGRVTRENLRQYRLWLEKHDISPQTVSHILSDARCFFGWCDDTGLVAKSPWPRRLMPRLQETPPKRLSDEEVEALTRIPDPYGFVIRFGLGTGLRWGEMCRAQASHVERGMLVVSQTKSGRVRRVPIPRDLLQEIRGRVGRLVPYTETSSSDFARIVRRLSGVEGFHAHRLRHTFASQWLERGGSLAAVQQILGHASIETTQRYARLTDEHVRAEAERLADAM